MTRDEAEQEAFKMVERGEISPIAVPFVIAGLCGELFVSPTEPTKEQK